MHTRLRSLFSLAGSILPLLIACSAWAQPGPLPDSALVKAPVDTSYPVSQAGGQSTCNRASVITDYVTNYLGSSVSTDELGWTGSVTGCVSGSISTQAQTKTIQRINYYRRLVGLSGTVTLDPSRNAGTQDAALMMLANNDLNHTPPTTWLCYTAAGKTAAGSSNLGYGAHSAQAIDIFMNDGGSSNTVTGHRRWILYTRQASFGHGATSGTDALWVFNSPVTPTAVPAFIAYPPAGYVPRNLVPARWSFSIPGASFSSSTVAVTSQTGTPVSLTQNAVQNGYGDNTLTWDMNPTDLVWNGTVDKAFDVRVSGVKIGGVTQPDYVYHIVAIEPSTPGLTLAATNPSCSGTSTNGRITATFDRGAKSYLWSNGATTQTATNLGAGTYTVTVTDQNDCTYSRSITLSNTTANVPQLAVSPTSTCPGTPVSLTATNCQGTITWSNGLGTGTSKSAMPAVTTTYSATCSETACIPSSSTITVSVAPGPTPACTATATSGLSPYYGVERFKFNTIDASSGSSIADGANYINRACVFSTTVTAGSHYSALVKGSFTNYHQCKVYIDYNNNGAFTDPGELVLTGAGNSVTATIAISSSAVTNVPLRMRVIADASGSSTACSLVGAGSYGAGQAEDYSLVILPGCNSLVTTKAGNWNDPTVWSCNRVPTAMDTLQINHAVTLPASLQALARQLTFGATGRLIVGTAAQLKLTP